MFGVVSLTMGNSPLPLADRRLGDEEPVGEFPLGEPQFLPAAADIRAEGLLVFHVEPSFRQGVVLQGRSHHTANGGNLQGPGGIFPLDR